MIQHQPPQKKEAKKENTYDKKPADSLEQASPDDARADEKVIVNEQHEDQVVNNEGDAKPL